MEEGKGLFDSVFTYSGILINVAVFYINYFLVLPRIVKSPNFSKVLVGVLSIISIYIFLKFLIEELFLKLILGYKVEGFPDTISALLFFSAIQSTMPILFSSFIWFVSYAFKAEREKQQLLEQKNEAEMSLLKSQINPHFIFNTLNNIYSLVNQKSDKSLNAIEKLGDLLRFSGTEINKDFTSLHNEIQYVRNYIDLESLRMVNPENIIFEDKAKNENLKITPMILIPFVENAFKHGNLKDSPLNILIETKGNLLHFYQRNKTSNQEKDKSSGIGIKNVRKRLSIIYPEKHSLVISDKNGFYEVNLTIYL